jgi:hypothetical protein
MSGSPRPRLPSPVVCSLGALVAVALTAAVLIGTRERPAPPSHPAALGESWGPMDLVMWLQGQGQQWRLVPARRRERPAVYFFADLPAALPPDKADEVAARVALLADAAPGEPPQLWRGVVLVEVHHGHEEAAAAAQGGTRWAWHRLTFSGDGGQVNRIRDVLP